MAQKTPLRWPPAPRTVTAAFLTLSFALSVSTLAVRNLYDDEISTLAVVISSPTSILHYAATVDIHPPGMYLLAHAAWLVIPSYRWMNLLPCLVLYAGLALFLFAITPLFRERRPLLVLLLITTLHPELLLWSNTFRWYSWWTGLALITLAVVLQPQIEMPSLGWARSLAIGILLAALFYLNYITLLFILALATAMLLRYRFVARSELLRHAAAIVAVFGLLIASQLHTMVVAQLHYASAERVRILASAVRLSEGLIASEAYLPWHPLAILVWLFFLALGVYGMVQFTHRTESEYRPPVECSPALRSITVLGVALFVLVVLAGLGNKPRSAIVLLPALAPVAAIAASRLRIRAQNGLLLFLALWSGVGIAHILGRYGLAKATMDDRPEQVVRFLQHDRGSGCAIVATYDMGLAFALREAHLPNVEELSAADGLASQSAALPQTATCTSARLYLVRSYLGTGNQWTPPVNTEEEDAAQAIEGAPQIHRFSLDPDASRKRSLARLPLLGRELGDAASLPDYRFVVTSGAINPKLLSVIETRLPDFVRLR